MKWRYVFFILALAIAYWFVYQWINARKGPLHSFVYNQLDAAVDRVNKGGQDVNLEFNIQDDATVIICPPYTSPSLFGNPFSNEVIKDLDKNCLMGAETGHMMYVLNGRVIDHQLLSGSAEPIVGWANGPNVKFNISKKLTSARPVRIQITNAAPLVLKPENEKFRDDLVLPDKA